MTPEFKIESDKFREVMKLWILSTRRELSAAVNARFAFMLMRTFALMNPQRVQQKRDEVRAYMDQPIGQARFDKRSGKTVGRTTGRLLRRVHLIAQARHAKRPDVEGDISRKGLYGKQMRVKSSALKRRAIGSVGYLKSTLIDAIKKVNGKYGFGQTGRNAQVSKTGRVIKAAMSPNAAFMRLLAEYGITSGTGNVAKMRGAKTTVMIANPSLNPNAMARFTVGVNDSQLARVQAEFTGPFTRALADERAEMERHLAEKLEAAALEAANGQPS